VKSPGRGDGYRECQELDRTGDQFAAGGGYLLGVVLWVERQPLERLALEDGSRGATTVP
jgi:hypothetical protein